MNIEDRIYLYNHVNRMITDLIRKQADFHDGNISVDDMVLIIRRKFADMIDIIDNM